MPLFSPVSNDLPVRKVVYRPTILQKLKAKIFGQYARHERYRGYKHAGVLYVTNKKCLRQKRRNKICRQQ